MFEWGYRERLSMEHVLQHMVFDHLRGSAVVEEESEYQKELLRFERPEGAEPLRIYVKYMELSDIDEPDAAIIVPAYQDTLQVSLIRHVITSLGLVW